MPDEWWRAVAGAGASGAAVSGCVLLAAELPRHGLGAARHRLVIRALAEGRTFGRRTHPAPSRSILILAGHHFVCRSLNDKTEYIMLSERVAVAELRFCVLCAVRSSGSAT